MTNAHSTFTDLPLSCKSAAERAARKLATEDAYAALPENQLKKVTQLEQEISHATGAQISLVAYRL